jgi:hypothetical protein
MKKYEHELHLVTISYVTNILQPQNVKNHVKLNNENKRKSKFGKMEII